MTEESMENLQQVAREKKKKKKKKKKKSNPHFNADPIENKKQSDVTLSHYYELTWDLEIKRLAFLWIS